MNDEHRAQVKNVVCAIIDSKKVTHTSGCMLTMPKEGIAVAVMSNEDGYSKSLSLLDIINLVTQFKIHHVQYEWREIGETDWAVCNKEWFDYCCSSPQHDTRIQDT